MWSLLLLPNSSEMFPYMFQGDISHLNLNRMLTTV
jgi:hypothetical protein